MLGSSQPISLPFSCTVIGCKVALPKYGEVITPVTKSSAQAGLPGSLQPCAETLACGDGTRCVWLFLSAIEALFRVIRDTTEYCTQRMVYGRPLIANQVIHYRLAELETEVEALRSLLYRTVGKCTEVVVL